MTTGTSSIPEGEKAYKHTLTQYDLNRLEAYSRNLVDHHLIADLLPRLAEFFFFSSSKVTLSALQQAILVGLGFQMKSVELFSSELNLPIQQILAMLNKAIRKISKFLSSKEGNEDEEEEPELENVIKTVPEVQSGTVISLPSKTPSKTQPVTKKEELNGDRNKSASSKKKFNRRSDKKHKRG